MPSIFTGSFPDRTPGRLCRYASVYPENERLLRWLRSEQHESVLEPELEIVDAHHHLWDLRGMKYDDFNVGPRGQVVYGMDELLEDMRDGHNVIKTGQPQPFVHHPLLPRARSDFATVDNAHGCVPLVRYAVFVQCNSGGQFPNWQGATGLPEAMRPLVEVEYCQGVAAQCDALRPGAPRICAGIVGTISSTPYPPGVLGQLLRSMCRVRNFRGIRASLPNCQDGSGVVSDPQFSELMDLLQQLNLSLDVVTGAPPLPGGHTGLQKIKVVALHYPSVTIVINHLGGNVPAMAGESLAQWRADIADVGRSCPNCVIKCVPRPTVFSFG